MGPTAVQLRTSQKLTPAWTGGGTLKTRAPDASAFDVLFEQEVKAEKDTQAKNFEQKLVDAAEKWRNDFGFDAMPAGTSMRMNLEAKWYDKKARERHRITIAEQVLESTGIAVE